MRNSERQQHIFELISRRGEQAAEALSRSMTVSLATIRRDLAALERRGLVRRTWGGAQVAVPVVYTEHDFQGEAIKRAIAAHAATLVEPDMVIAMSGGSTCTELARWLRGRRVRVVTKVVLSGGELNVASYELVGEMVSHSLSEYRVDTAFVGCSGIATDFGFSMRDDPEANAARALARVAERVVVLADHRKVGRRTFTRFARLNDVERLITDDGISPELLQELRDAGLQVDVAPHLDAARLPAGGPEPDSLTPDLPTPDFLKDVQ